MKFHAFSALLLISCLPALQAATEESLGDITLKDGRTLRKVSLLRAEPDALRLEHATGVSRIPFEDLPESIRQQFAFDPAKAAAHRKAAADSAAARAAQETQQLAEQTARRESAQLEADVQRAREEFHDLLANGGYNFAKVDKALADSISILRKAGRDDLADQIEKDRATLVAREPLRASQEAQREREQLLTRIRNLEAEIAQLRNQPAPVAVVQQTEFFPFFIDRPILIPTPVNPAPCPSPLPILNLTNGIPYVTPPAARPISNPILARQPNVPQADGGRASAPPIRTRQPNVPPIRVNQPNVAPIGSRTLPRSPLPQGTSQGSLIPPASGVPLTGSHLWQRRSR
jgi:hypothetical protein